MLGTQVGTGSRATLATERSWKDAGGVLRLRPASALYFSAPFARGELSHVTTPVQGALGNAV